MSADDKLLFGLGLVIVLAFTCRLVAAYTRLPAIVLLLPVGFAAGAATDDVHPDVLFGSTFGSIVDIAVGLILFEAGLRLKRGELAGVGSVVRRLVIIGVAISAVGVTIGTELLFGLSWRVSLLVGAILVVSGPTVVLPLLAFVRPTPQVRSVLKFEGTLIDPLGALLGVAAFTVAQADYHPGNVLLSLVVGILVGLLAAALLWALLDVTQRVAPGQSVTAMLAVVIAAIVVADLLRQDSGFTAALVMGVALANQRRVDISRVAAFEHTIVDLMIAVLFVLISASVEPSAVWHVLGKGVALVAIIVLLLRPVSVVLSTIGSELKRNERAFVGWMAPRGIVAASTASAFSITLQKDGVPGAQDILPIAFIVILGTVSVYGLTALPVARWLGVTGGADTVLVIGGHAWARQIAAALGKAGLRVKVWTSSASEREAAEKEGLDAGWYKPGQGASIEESLEEVSDVLLLTDNDNFNALAAAELRHQIGSAHVFRLPPTAELFDVVPAYAEGTVLFGPGYTYPELSQRFAAGAQLSSHSNGQDPLFVVTENLELRVRTRKEPVRAAAGETVITLVGGQ
jgi:NhaP-type Na+/H+ or K+/H+ antiporter